MSATCSLLVTFGTATDNCTGTIACASLVDAAREAAKVIECRADYQSPLMSVVIQSGDYAPRLSNGAWVAAPETGWED